MELTDKNLTSFTNGLVKNKPIDPNTLRLARCWYKNFAGSHAVTMNDRELIEIYQELQ